MIQPLSFYLVLTVGGGTQILVDAHLTFNPVVLFQLDFPQQPAGAAPIQATKPGTQLSQNGTVNERVLFLGPSSKLTHEMPFGGCSDGGSTTVRAIPK